ESTNSNLLGETLYQAGLISNTQIETALADRQDSSYLRVGEIMALRGWIEQKTADFFAEEWHILLNQAEKHPLGYYLERSGLLTQEQTESILEEQKKIWVKFGSVAVLQGILAQETVDFFLNNLFPLESLDSALIGKKDLVAKVEMEREQTSPPAETVQPESIQGMSSRSTSCFDSG
ncbi:MAG: hypothetical protein AAFR89_07810, partial [Cyanobacteria bacterium J06633_1]